MKTPPEAIAWVGDRTMAQAYRDCERADWIMWLLSRKAGKRGWPTRQTVVSLACDCAERALKYVPAGEDRPRRAIEAARTWAAAPTPKNTSAAVRSAWSAAGAAEEAVGAAPGATEAAASSAGAAWAAGWAAADGSAAEVRSEWLAEWSADWEAAGAAVGASGMAAWAVGAAGGAAGAAGAAEEEAGLAAWAAEHRAMCDMIREKVKIPTVRRRSSLA
jgi:hypothetical protein